MKRILGYASLGLVGCDALVFEYEYDETDPEQVEEVENAIDSGEIYDWIERDGVQQHLDLRYEIESE